MAGKEGEGVGGCRGHSQVRREGWGVAIAGGSKDPVDHRGWLVIGMVRHDEKRGKGRAVSGMD